MLVDNLFCPVLPMGLTVEIKSTFTGIVWYFEKYAYLLNKNLVCYYKYLDMFECNDLLRHLKNIFYNLHTPQLKIVCVCIIPCCSVVFSLDSRSVGPEDLPPPAHCPCLGPVQSGLQQQRHHNVWRYEVLMCILLKVNWVTCVLGLRISFYLTGRI